MNENKLLHERSGFRGNTKLHILSSASFCVSGILEKNRDTFSADLYDLLGQSKCRFLLHLFDKELKMVSIWMVFKTKFLFLGNR